MPFSAPPVAFATQADQEAGASMAAAVPSGRQQLHPSAAKGFVNAGTAGTSSLSYNVASLTDVGAGILSVVWDIDFSSANYVPLVAIQDASSPADDRTCKISATFAPTAGETRFICWSYQNGTVAIDPQSRWYIVIFGDRP